jgi:hypothetical protein
MRSVSGPEPRRQGIDTNLSNRWITLSQGSATLVRVSSSTARGSSADVRTGTRPGGPQMWLAGSGTAQRCRFWDWGGRKKQQRKYSDPTVERGSLGREPGAVPQAGS